MVDEKQEEYSEDMLQPVAKELVKKKFGPARIACIIDQAGRAKTVKHTKIKGVITEGSLGPGHKIVATARGDLEDEHLIQYTSPDHPLRMKAAEQAAVFQGLKPKDDKGGLFGGAVINVFTNIEPRKRLDKAAYKRIEDKGLARDD
jgi:hypothetical protein